MGYVIHSSLWMANGIMLHNKTVHQSMGGCVSCNVTFRMVGQTGGLFTRVCQIIGSLSGSIDETYSSPNSIMFQLQYTQ